MTAVSFSTQAKLLARYLREQGLARLSQSEALEALAHAQNFKSFNEAQATERCTKKSVHEKALTLLAQAKAHGLTQADARAFFARFRSAAELAFVAEARGYHQEGECEIDEDAEVSMAPRAMEAGGAYVQMWRWIDVSEVTVPVDLLDAIDLPWRTFRVCINDGDYMESAFSDLEVNEAAVAALRAGEGLSEQLWLIKSKTSDACLPVITVKHYRAIAFEEQDCWTGKVNGDDWFIEMDVV